MSAIIIMVIISLILACGFLLAFIWAVNSGQFRDSQTPGIRILHERPPVKAGKNTPNQKE